jgi:hypothetical protein
MKLTLPFLATALSLPFTHATPIPDAVAPPSTAPSAFKIVNVVHGGSGCPQGSLNLTWTDTQLLPITFPPAFTASVGPSAPVTAQRKNCQISIAISHSPGYALAVYSATFSGWADLEAGVEGTVKATTYFAGESDQTSTSLVIPGPYRGVYEKRDFVPLTVWSGCEGEILLNVNTQISVSPSGGPASGRLVQSRESGKLSEQFYMQWKKC